MILRIIVAVIALYIAFQLIRYFRRLSPEQQKKSALQYGAWGVLIIAVLLFATGRLHWIGALIGGLLPFAARIVSILPRLMPFLSFIGKTGFANSLLKTPFIQLTIDPSNGRITGTVLSSDLEGLSDQLEGKPLDSLSMSELSGLLETFKSEHPQSARLLGAYMRFRFNDSQHHSEQEQVSSNPSNISSRSEALEILGLTEEATEKDIITAHRRLIQKLHPDRGGSDYLAAVINQAKDFLLKT